jgi:hypothetical protein
METKTETRNKIWILAFTLLFTGVTIAATQSLTNPASSQTNITSQERTSMPMIRATRFFTVRDLIGSDVKSMATVTSEQNKNAATEKKNEKAEKIGTVKDVVINNSQNKMDYVVIDSDGKLYPVPWTAFNFSGIAKPGAQSTQSSITRSENIGQDMYESSLEPTMQIPTSQREKLTLYLDMNKTELQKAPITSSVSTEKLSEPTMRQDIDKFYSRYMQQNSGMTEKSPSMSITSATNLNLITASKVFDLKMQGSPGTDLKKIENIVGDAPQGHVLYALVNYGGFLDIGEKTSAVPWQTLTINEKEGYAKINATREKLDAAAIEPGQWYKLEQSQFARQIYSDFGVEPSTVYGFVPGEITEENFSAWKPDSAYNKNFDKSKMTSIKGTVRNVSTFEPTSGAAHGVQLTVETSDGKMVIVYAGPQEYAKEKEFTCKTGDQVEITGSTAKINNNSVVIASKIKNGNKTLDLYNSEGKPLWNTEQLMKSTIKY